MLLFQRPPTPRGFKEFVKPYQEAVKKAIQAGDKPEFPNKWGDYKRYFARKQFKKCGYCEMDAIASQHGDIEHYRPKAEVKAIDPQFPGEEDEDLASITSGTRKFLSVAETGYWWLAYDWKNYLLACQKCNQTFKQNLFPVKEKPREKIEPGVEDRETPLLLNPFGEIDPAEHLEFTPLGGIKARNNSEYGQATIEVCGLYRSGLLLQRQEKAERIFALIQRLALSTSETAETQILKDLYQAGNEKYPHAGMVRIIVKQELDLGWDELKQLADP